MSDEIATDIDGRVDSVMEILGNDKEAVEDAPEVAEAQETAKTGEETLTEEDKPNEEGKVEPEAALEPPASWRSDEKELFKNLPRETQEVHLRLQQAQDSHFTQRSTELAQKIQGTDDARQQYQAERARYAQSLAQLDEMANQLLPAKFSDIRSEADYLRLKATDPARASEYEAFNQILSSAKRERDAVSQSQMKERLNREWGTFVSKNPEFQDVTKATAMMDGIRKGAVEYYGYTPQETQVIADHRQIVVMRDALAWRQYQSNLKAVGLKKTNPAAQRVIKSTSNVANGGDKSALLNRARKTDNVHNKTDLITKYLEQVG